MTRRLLDVVHREQMLEEARLDSRSVGAVLAGEVRLEGDHAAAHLQVFPQVRRPRVHLAAAGAHVQSRPHDRKERRI